VNIQNNVEVIQRENLSTISKSSLCNNISDDEFSEKQKGLISDERKKEETDEEMLLFFHYFDPFTKLIRYKTIFYFVVL
jgi:hypothetical protein